MEITIKREDRNNAEVAQEILFSMKPGQVAATYEQKDDGQDTIWVSIYDSLEAAWSDRRDDIVDVGIEPEEIIGNVVFYID